MNWLDATQHLKGLRRKDKALQAFSKILARRGPEIHDAMMSRVVSVSYTSLLRGRGRLDAVSCLLWRKFFASEKNTALFIWIDASPQHGGEELLSTVVDVMVDAAFFRRILLPAICLPRRFWSSREALRFTPPAVSCLGPGSCADSDVQSRKSDHY